MSLGRVFIILGFLFLVIGLILIFKDRLPLLRYLGRLPGDIVIERENFKLYFPLATSIVLSVILSLIFWLFRSR